jgi:solute carrier family 25 phosphate transporter 23/24/25/41
LIVVTILILSTTVQASGMPGRPVYNSPADAIRKIFADEGMLGFFRGFVPNLLKVVPAAALSYGVYDGLNKNL